MAGSSKMSLLLFSALFFCTFNVLPSAQENSGGIVLDRFTPTQGMQYQPKCHVRRSFTHVLADYKMTCFQCSDKESSFVISHRQTLILAATVAHCGKVFLTLSVSVVPENQRKGADYSIELAYLGNPCVRVNFWINRMDGETQRCEYRTSYTGHTFIGYINGWKLKKPSWETGVVRLLLPVANVMEYYSCPIVRSLVHDDSDYTMKCLNCANDFVIVIYRKNIPMAVASVGTCRSRRLEDSIDILPPAKARPSEPRVQYRLNSDRCIIRNYQSSAQSFIEKSDEIECPLKSIYSLAGLIGYKNCWKETVNN